jgi:hypothetical protein
MANLPEDPDEYVTVRDFIDSGEALMAKGALESAGVECLLVNENVSRMYGGVLAVQLQVHKKDEADALSLLDSSDDGLDPDERIDGEE